MSKIESAEQFAFVLWHTPTDEVGEGGEAVRLVEQRDAQIRRQERERLRQAVESGRTVFSETGNYACVRIDDLRRIFDEEPGE